MKNHSDDTFDILASIIAGLIIGLIWVVVIFGLAFFLKATWIISKFGWSLL